MHEKIPFYNALDYACAASKTKTQIKTIRRTEEMRNGCWRIYKSERT